MAHTPSSKKRIRQTATRTAKNRARVSRVRTAVRDVEDAIKKGDAKGAASALKNAQSTIMKGAAKGVVKKRAASRKVSRLSGRVKALSTSG